LQRIGEATWSRTLRTRGALDDGNLPLGQPAHLLDNSCLLCGHHWRSP